jgi:hypothetical protein
MSPKPSRDAAEQPPIKTQGSQRLSQVLTENDVALVFGVHWIPVTSDVRLGKLLETARQDGYVNYVSHSYQDTVGFMGALPSGLKKAYSAAIILSLQFSEGGTELFVFQQDGLYGLVGLIEYSPMPGFDAIGTEKEIFALAEEFKLLNASQLLRFYGNVPWFPDHEALELIKVAQKAATTKSTVQVIPNVKRLMALIAISLFLLGGLYAGYSYYQDILQEQEASMQAALNDPNRLYETAIALAMKTTGTPGVARLNQWRAFFDKLPLVVEGWAAKTVTCVGLKCDVQWVRVSGNLNDFEAALPEAVHGKTAFKLDKGLVNSELHSTHDLANFPKVQGIDKSVSRDELNSVISAQNQWGSALQNISLLPKSTVTMTPAGLFGNATAALEALNKPVVKGTWALEHDLWSLPDLDIPNFVVPETLTVQIDLKTTLRYKLEGAYYAKGK